MLQIAALAGQGVQALRQRDAQRLASLMSDNFRLRRRIYGDDVVGAASIGLAECAASVGAAAKLTGSGGAVVALCPGGPQQADRLHEACAARGIACEAVRVGPTLHPAGSAG